MSVNSKIKSERENVKISNFKSINSDYQSKKAQIKNEYEKSVEQLDKVEHHDTINTSATIENQTFSKEQK